MQNPFPGMDPWLELYWRDVHARLIIYIADHLQHQLPEPLVARAEEDVSVDIEDVVSPRIRPDVRVAEAGRASRSGGIATMSSPMDVATPLLVHVPEPEVDRRVEIIDPSSGGRVVTAIEVLSPSNKLPGRARLAYESKQSDLLAAGVNLVEIDLVRRGSWAFSASETILPPRKREPYMICVFRATNPGARAIYPMALREQLPRIAIPLRRDDRDVVLDLQQIINQAYEAGRYDRTDYSRPLDPPLPVEDASWAADLLHRAGRF